MGPFGLRIKLPPAAHLSVAHGGGFTLSFFIVERQAVNTNFIVFGFDYSTGNRPGVLRCSSGRSIHSTLICYFIVVCLHVLQCGTHL